MSAHSILSSHFCFEFIISIFVVVLFSRLFQKVDIDYQSLSCYYRFYFLKKLIEWKTLKICICCFCFNCCRCCCVSIYWTDFYLKVNINKIN